MTDTRDQLLDAATALFLEQGFAKTTIQQIADRVGISKGAFYLHFRSKSQLMVGIMQSLGDSILEKVEEILARDDLSPREQLRAQLRYHFDEVLEHQQLMELYFREANISIDNELLLVAQKVRIDWQQTQEAFIRRAFPDHDPAFTADLTVSLNGALNEYYTYVLLDGVSIDADRVADLLLAMTEAMVERLARGDVAPVLGPNALPGSADLEAQLIQARDERISVALEEMLAEAQDLGEDASQEVGQTVDLLRDMLAQEDPNPLLLQGLLANLRDLKSLLPQRRRLAAELGIKLI